MGVINYSELTNLQKCIEESSNATNNFKTNVFNNEKVWEGDVAEAADNKLSQTILPKYEQIQLLLKELEEKIKQAEKYSYLEEELVNLKNSKENAIEQSKRQYYESLIEKVQSEMYLLKQEIKN